MVDVLRVGVIGAGGMGSEHARNLVALSGVEIGFVADVDIAAAERLAEEVDAAATRPISDAATLAVAGIDALVIASPDDTHADFARMAIDAGTPTLCEKPLAETADDAHRIMAAEVAAGRRLVHLGLMRELDPAHRQLRTAAAEVGPPLHVRCVHRNRNDFVRTADVIVSQSLVHDFHTVHWLTAGLITEVSTAAIHHDGICRVVAVHGRTANGVLFTVEFEDAAFGYEVSVEVTGAGGHVTMAAPPRPEVRRAEHATRRVGRDWFGAFAEAYRAEAASFVAGVRAGAVGGPSAWDGFAAQTVVSAAQASAAKNAPVGIEWIERPSLYGER